MLLKNSAHTVDANLQKHTLMAVSRRRKAKAPADTEGSEE